MWIYFPAHDFFLSLSIIITIWLSWNIMSVSISYPCAGSHLLWLILPQCNVLHLITILCNCSALACIQMTYRRWCVSLGQDVPHMWHLTMWIVGWGCRYPSPSYNWFYVSEIVAHASTFISSPQCSWSTCCTEMIYLVQWKFYPIPPLYYICGYIV